MSFASLQPLRLTVRYYWKSSSNRPLALLYHGPMLRLRQEPRISCNLDVALWFFTPFFNFPFNLFHIGFHPPWISSPSVLMLPPSNWISTPTLTIVLIASSTIEFSSLVFSLLTCFLSRPCRSYSQPLSLISLWMSFNDFVPLPPCSFLRCSFVLNCSRGWNKQGGGTFLNFHKLGEGS